MLVKLKQLVLFYNPAADADTPSNLMVRQNGRLSIEINWTPSATPPSMGYQITTVEDVSVGIIVMNPPYTYAEQEIKVGDVINIYLVARSAHFFSGVLGPVSVTILGKDMSHILLVLTVLNVACISPTRYTGSNSHIIISDCHYSNYSFSPAYGQPTSRPVHSDPH